MNLLLDDYLNQPIDWQVRSSYLEQLEKIAITEKKYLVRMLIPSAIFFTVLLIALGFSIGWMISSVLALPIAYFSIGRIGDIASKKALETYALTLSIDGHDYTTGSIPNFLDKYRPIAKPLILEPENAQRLFNIIELRGVAFQFEVNLLNAILNDKEYNAFSYFKAEE